MLSSAIAGMPLVEISAHWALPFIIGIFFAYLMRKQLLEKKCYSERWLIVLTTLLFCMLLDVFIKVEANIGNQDIPIANATFVIGLFLTLFFKLEPHKQRGTD